MYNGSITYEGSRNVYIEIYANFYHVALKIGIFMLRLFFNSRKYFVLFQNWEVMNTAVLTGRQVSQGMKVFIVSQAGTVADVTLQSSCHSEDESVLKVIAF